VAICGYFRPVASPSHYFTVMTSIAQDPKILLVDDNAVVRDMLVDLVGSLGYAADAASGGAEALALFDQNRYDIVLTDLLMPGMSGWEVLAAVRQRNPRIPVVIITGTAPTADDPRAAQAGVTVLRKPVDVKALDDTIKEKLTGRLTV
jgi:two-component system, NarL family, capsular synthesis sensor histidine kinase RcsC